MIGRTVGRYRVVAPLGEGGMGTVWKAEDQLLGRPVALKLLSADLAAVPEARRRFLREARAVSALSHPGICAVWDAGESHGEVFIALAWVDGQTISALAERAPLAIGQVIAIGIAAAEALGFAHAHGVVHRDVTGRNIMLARDGRVVVLDFGLALAVGLSRMTSSGGRVGTPAYLSPEVVRGETADARSDLYGLGVVLYEALTGRLPFERERPEAMMYAILNEAAESPTRLRRDTPPGLERIVMRLLEKAPAERFPDAEALAAALREEARAHVTREPPAPRWTEEAALPGSPARRRFLAVMPFESAAAEATAASESDDVFARGLAAALSTALAAVPDLHVVPPAVAAREEPTDDLRQFARQLGANLILRASVRRAGGRLRVTWSLLEPARGIQVGGATVEGLVADAFGLEDRLVSSVLDALGCERPPGGARGRPPRDPAARERLVQALGYLQRYEHEASVDGAIGLLERLREGEPGNAEVEAVLGRAYLHKFQLTLEPRWEALGAAACERAMELQPDSPDVLVTLGQLSELTGQLEREIRSFERALELDPGRPDALLGLGRAYHDARRLDDAERVLRSAIERQPDYWGTHNALGRFLLRVGRFEEALAAFERVIRLTPDNARGWLNLAAAHFALERFEPALEACRRSIEIRPRAQSLSTLGAILFYLGSYAESAVAFERGVALQPNDALMWGNLGSACRFIPGHEHRMRESLERALALARERLDRNPRDAAARAQMAGWLSNLGRHEEAVESVLRALELEPENPEYRAKACTVYHLAGDRERSLEWLRSAIARGYRTAQLLRDPHLSGLRSDPAFMRIVEDEAQRHGSHHP